MPSIQEDLIDGATASQGPDGFSATRAFIVTDIEGTAAAKVGLAIVAPGIPRRGEPHPAIAGIYVDSIQAAPLKDSVGSVRVEVNYKKFDSASEQEPNEAQPAILSIGGTLVQVETNRDVLGKLIEVFYIDPDTPNPAESDLKVARDPVMVDESCVVFSLQRKEPKGEIASKVVRYTNTVSAEGNFGSPAHTWKCTRIEARSDDGGETYQVSYEFQYREQTWDATVIYLERDTQQPPPGINNPPGNGIKKIQLYKEEDFGALGLFANG